MERVSHDLTKTIFWTVLHRLIVILMVAGSIASTACMVYSVILRYAFKGNFYGSDEVIMLFAFWLYFMGAAYGSFEDSHIKADLLTVYLKDMHIKDLFTIVSELLTVAVNTVVLSWATRFFFSEIAKWGLSTSLKIPLIIPKSSIFFGFLLMEFYHVYYLQRHLRTYIKTGVCSDPRPGDYISESLRNKHPELKDIPTKAELQASGNQGKEADE